MDYLLKDVKLELKYQAGKGAWTYHLQIPNTKHIIAKWGALKVSGTIDHYPINSMNLFTIAGQDKLLSINQNIRKAINKSGGDTVTVTLYRLAATATITAKDILASLKEAGVLTAFQKLSEAQQTDTLTKIIAFKTEEKQIKAIVQLIEQLSVKRV